MNYTSQSLDFVTYRNGRGISGVVEYYYASTSDKKANANLPAPGSSQWKTEVSETNFNSTNKFLWNYETINYDDGVNPTQTAPTMIAVYSKDGNGIVSIQEFYILTEIGTEPTSFPTGTNDSQLNGWSLTVPTPTESTPMLWNYQITTYTKTDPVVSGPNCIGYHGRDGKPGPKGDKGDQGTGVSVKVNEGSCSEIGDSYIDPDGNLMILTSISPREFTNGGQIKGPKGDSIYFHTAYANSIDGRTDFSTSNYTNKEYIGHYTDSIEADSEEPSDYKWMKLKGEKGSSIKKINTYIRDFPYYDTSEEDPYSWTKPKEGSNTAFIESGHSETWTAQSPSYNNSHINIGDTAYLVGTVKDRFSAGGIKQSITLYGQVTAVNDQGVTMTTTTVIWGGTQGEEGPKGDSGKDAQDFNISASSYVLSFDAENNRKPDSKVTLTAHAINLDISKIQWSEDGDTWEKKGDKTYTVTKPGTYYAKIEDFQDSVTIGKTIDGATGRDAISITLTNPTMTFNSSTSGEQETCRVLIYEGATKLDTKQFTVGKADEDLSGVSIDKDVITVYDQTENGHCDIIVNVNTTSGWIKQVLTIYWTVVQNGETPYTIALSDTFYRAPSLDAIDFNNVITLYKGTEEVPYSIYETILDGSSEYDIEIDSEEFGIEFNYPYYDEQNQFVKGSVEFRALKEKDGKPVNKNGGTVTFKAVDKITWNPVARASFQVSVIKDGVSPSVYKILPSAGSFRLNDHNFFAPAEISTEYTITKEDVMEIGSQQLYWTGELSYMYEDDERTVQIMMGKDSAISANLKYLPGVITYLVLSEFAGQRINFITLEQLEEIIDIIDVAIANNEFTFQNAKTAMDLFVNFTIELRDFRTEFIGNWWEENNFKKSILLDKHSLYFLKDGEKGETGTPGNSTYTIYAYYQTNEERYTKVPFGISSDSPTEVKQWYFIEPEDLSKDWPYLYRAEGLKTVYGEIDQEKTEQIEWRNTVLYKAWNSVDVPYDSYADYLRLTNFGADGMHWHEGKLYVNATALKVQGPDENQPVFEARGDADTVAIGGWTVDSNKIAKSNEAMLYAGNEEKYQEAGIDGKLSPIRIAAGPYTKKKQQAIQHQGNKKYSLSDMGYYDEIYIEYGDDIDLLSDFEPIQATMAVVGFYYDDTGDRRDEFSAENISILPGHLQDECITFNFADNYKCYHLISDDGTPILYVFNEEDLGRLTINDDGYLIDTVTGMFAEVYEPPVTYLDISIALNYSYNTYIEIDVTDSAPFYVLADGHLHAESADISGKITAKNGTIGGWNIGTNTIYRGGQSTTRDGVAIVGGSSNIAISLGYTKNQLDTGNLILYKNGLLEASKANITGTIHAQKGSISQWTIDQNGGFYCNGERPGVSENTIYFNPMGYDNIVTISGLRSNSWALTIGQKFGVTQKGQVGCTSLWIPGSATPEGHGIEFPFWDAYGIYKVNSRIGYVVNEGLVLACFDNALDGYAGGIQLNAVSDITLNASKNIKLKCGNGYNIYFNDKPQLTTSTSDERIKKLIEKLPIQYETLFDLLEPTRYKYIDGTSDRYHTGFVVQKILSALEESELTTQDFAAVVLDRPGTENECWYLRRDEIVALNTWQIQKLKPRMTAAEEKILALETEITSLKSELENLKSSQNSDII